MVKDLDLIPLLSPRLIIPLDVPAPHYTTTFVPCTTQRRSPCLGATSGAIRPSISPERSGGLDLDLRRGIRIKFLHAYRRNIFMSESLQPESSAGAAVAAAKLGPRDQAAPGATVPGPLPAIPGWRLVRKPM